MQDYNKFPEQRVSDKSSQAALAHERNYYDGDSSAPSSRHGNPSFRNADEYEAYAIQQLNRHRSMRSEQYEGATVYDYGDPKRRHDVDNAV